MGRVANLHQAQPLLLAVRGMLPNGALLRNGHRLRLHHRGTGSIYFGVTRALLRRRERVGSQATRAALLRRERVGSQGVTRALLRHQERVGSQAAAVPNPVRLILLIHRGVVHGQPLRGHHQAGPEIGSPSGLTVLVRAQVRVANRILR